MKIGDYVRIVDNLGKQFIGKIYNINEFREPSMKYAIDCQIFNDYAFIGDERIVKSNPNILELLEPMDLLYIDISPDDCGGIVVPRIPETLDELNNYINRIKSGECILKGVVTREQIENNMYKVGE